MSLCDERQRCNTGHTGQALLVVASGNVLVNPMVGPNRGPSCKCTRRQQLTSLMRSILLVAVSGWMS